MTDDYDIEDWFHIFETHNWMATHAIPPKTPFVRFQTEVEAAPEFLKPEHFEPDDSDTENTE